mmetsp:Transcript_12579/g.34675  ORF Transcript_12579/g.34675 Transcript_12579/m.34675 type:complete len:210 (-) Transcript_12579:35-664(-)
MQYMEHGNKFQFPTLFSLSIHVIIFSTCLSSIHVPPCVYIRIHVHVFTVFLFSLRLCTLGCGSRNISAGRFLVSIDCACFGRQWLPFLLLLLDNHHLLRAGLRRLRGCVVGPRIVSRGCWRRCHRGLPKSNLRRGTVRSDGHDATHGSCFLGLRADHGSLPHCLLGLSCGVHGLLQFIEEFLEISHGGGALHVDGTQVGDGLSEVGQLL